jgi:hypothetical protein
MAEKSSFPWDRDSNRKTSCSFTAVEEATVGGREFYFPSLVAGVLGGGASP